MDKLSRKTVTMMIVGIWLWATPFSVMPFLEIWGRFVPGLLNIFKSEYRFENVTNLFFFMKRVF